MLSTAHTRDFSWIGAFAFRALDRWNLPLAWSRAMRQNVGTVCSTVRHTLPIMSSIACQTGAPSACGNDGLVPWLVRTSAMHSCRSRARSSGWSPEVRELAAAADRCTAPSSRVKASRSSERMCWCCDSRNTATGSLSGSSSSSTSMMCSCSSTLRCASRRCASIFCRISCMMLSTASQTFLKMRCCCASCASLMCGPVVESIGCSGSS